QLTHRTKLIIEEMSIPGVNFLSHPVRNYTSQSVGNIFGYLGEVSPDDIAKDDYYAGGDYVGKIGLELTYERELRGEKGFTYKMVDVHGVVRGDYDEGKSNLQPIQGMALKSTIDIVLQDLGVRLMKGKVGAIVAIEPSTGEVLAMVTAPTFNPDSLVGVDMGATYNKLVADPRRPLFNRAVMGGYSPGSTFKIANALLVLKDRVASSVERFDCNMGWSVPGRRVKCHAHSSPVDMEFAIQTSCNAYFCATFRRLLRSGIHGGMKSSFNAWSNSIKQFGFGVQLDTDIMGVQRGFIPDASFYDRMYNGRWNDITVISLSIGQGEITTSPLQIANFTAIIANRGHYFMPHLVR
ncbi:MAG: penicillin-binding transpeptidase domain-containing protein, partial [Rikenellaceae bacterium]